MKKCFLSTVEKTVNMNASRWKPRDLIFGPAADTLFWGFGWVVLCCATGERQGEMAPSTDRELDLLLSKLRKIQVMDAGLGGGE